MVRVNLRFLDFNTGNPMQSQLCLLTNHSRGKLGHYSKINQLPEINGKSINLHQTTQKITKISTQTYTLILLKINLASDYAILNTFH
jgi:hypothetical protein